MASVMAVAATAASVAGTAGTTLTQVSSAVTQITTMSDQVMGSVNTIAAGIQTIQDAKSGTTQCYQRISELNIQLATLQQQLPVNLQTMQQLLASIQKQIQNQTTLDTSQQAALQQYQIQMQQASAQLSQVSNIVDSNNRQLLNYKGELEEYQRQLAAIQMDLQKCKSRYTLMQELVGGFIVFMISAIITVLLTKKPQKIQQYPIYYPTQQYILPQLQTSQEQIPQLSR